MKYWVQFLQESTGYVEGSIPPRFDDAHKKLIDACGSDGCQLLDGRLSMRNMHTNALYRAQRLEHFKQYSAYVLCKGPRFCSEIHRTPVRTLTYPIHV